MDSMLLYRGWQFNPNFFYHAGVDAEDAFLLVENKRKILVLSRLSDPMQKKDFSGDIIVEKRPADYLKKILKGKKISADAASLSAKMWNALEKSCSLADCSKSLLEKRRRKNPDEVRMMKRAAKLTREIMLSVASSDNKTEQQLANELLKETLDRGLEPAFRPIVASGKNSSVSHHRPSGKKIRGAVLVDYGVRYKHYCADLTRCIIPRGERKQQEIYENLQNIVQQIVDELPGLDSGQELAKFSEKLFKRKGLPRLPHSIGHGIGLDVHEFPRISKKYKDSLKGSVFTLEPSVYLKNFGLRYEDMVYFDGKKARVL